jgi:hypothetical protein
VEGVSEPNAETGVILGEDLRHVIVRDKLSLMELREYPYGEGILDWFEVYLRERSEYAILPVPVSKESVKVRMIV